jgi:hypothetical protein
MDDATPDFVLATYKEIAARFGLGAPSAARVKVKRAGWITEPPNHPADPRHIRVPRGAWEKAAETPSSAKPETPGSKTRETWTINAFRSAVNVLEKRLERADAWADAAEERVRKLTEQNAQLREAKAAVEAEARLHKAELERLRVAPGAPVRPADWRVWWSRFVPRRRPLT